jgi:probable rRNA maturation factor
VDVSFTTRRQLLSTTKVRDLVVATLASERIRDALISVAFVGTAAIAKLNRKFLSRSRSTDVIAFGFAREADAFPVMGDIYVCPAIAERNARRLGISVKEELARLVVHGTLHILGHDHPKDESRSGSPMWRRQERILESFR